jgi:hypothetical protein
MAGVSGDGEVDFEDAIGIASFQIAMGRIPPAAAWVDGLVESADAEQTEAFAESFF